MRLKILPLLAALMVLACAPEARAANCASPTEVEATLLYNQAYHIPQYCDGTNWIATGRAGLDSGLVGWWKFDDGSGTNATDSSGSGNNGTLTNGPAWATGQIGGAASFDGTNDYVSTGNIDLSGTNVVTIAFWLKWNAFADDDDIALELTDNFNNYTTGFLVDPNLSGISQFGIGVIGNVGRSCSYFT